MGTKTGYMITKEDLKRVEEDAAETAKVAIMDALVSEKILEKEAAEEWCRTHAVILRKKNIFRTISNLWSKQEESDRNFYIVVRAVVDDA